MTTAQTTNATETQAAKTKEQLQSELKSINAQLKAMETAPVTKTNIDWADTGKAIGIFVGGAAVGAAGKLAWDHFFG